MPKSKIPKSLGELLAFFSKQNRESEVLNRPTDRPLYNGPMENVFEVHQREFAVTNSNAKHPVLATYGVGPCISLVGYEPTEKIGFVAHYDALTDLEGSLGALLYHTTRIRSGKTSNFQTRIIGGQSGESSERIIDFLKHKVNNFRSDVQFTLVEEDTLGYQNRTIALDARNGKTYAFDPKMNPYMREVHKSAEMRLSLPGKASLAYTPLPLNQQSS